MEKVAQRFGDLWAENSCTTFGNSKALDQIWFG